MNGRGCLPPGVWIHLPLGDLGHMVWKGVRRRLRLVLAGGHASAWISPFWRGPAPGGQSTQAVEAYLATTYPPVDVEQAVASGLLGSPLLGTSTRVTADWCHAWSVLGQWSGLVTFPVPASGVWPRHGHLRRILDGYQGRQPNFHKWARPAYEQGALPTLSLLPGEVSVRVLPGDKMYQAMTIEPHYMRPVILHGFGTNAKKRMPSSLAELAQFGWLPLAAALFGTQEWKPQWLHPNFLPVVGLRLHAKVPPVPLSQAQLTLLCGLWHRKEQSAPSCTSLQLRVGGKRKKSNFNLFFYDFF